MPSELQKNQILCVDDSVDSTEMLTLWLKMKGYEVQCAQNCTEALALAEHQRFAACIIDSRLPDGTGVELARKVRQLWPQMSLILNTADVRPTIKAEAEAVGMMVIPKPTDLDFLHGVVKQLVV